MLDFLMVSERVVKKGGLETIEIYPKFKIRNPSQDLMIKGNDFYAIWDERKNFWSTTEQDAVEIIDEELDAYARELASRNEPRPIRVLHMWDAETGVIDRWHNYCKKQMRDTFHMLDEKLIFANMTPRKEDFSSKKLPYPLEAGSTTAWDTLIGQLYAPEEKHKIEWCIGSVVSGDSKKNHKFMVFYGEPGAGKSTVLDIIDKKLFVGYSDSVDSKALGSSSNRFAMESFKNNPLIAIQHEGDLSNIEDNTRLNSLVSHDKMTVEEKFKGLYTNSFKSFLILSSNKPVKITDSKSGILRRLIDVSPTGNLFPRDEYNRLFGQIDFELGAIARKCLDIYLSDPNYYDKYVPVIMLNATNDFYNFVMEYWYIFSKQSSITLKQAWTMYNTFCEETRVPHPYSQQKFKEELKSYFKTFQERATINGERVRNVYSDFRSDKFNVPDDEPKPKPNDILPDWLNLTDHDKSLLDDYLADELAQYPLEDGGRLPKKWANCTTHLRDLDPHRVHMVQVPLQLIVIDFDLKTDGVKDLMKSLLEAMKWPPTYAELSQSGKALHLYYIYSGDVEELSSVYSDQIEVKTLTGLQSLRRKLTKCNDIPIATISSGLPKKEVKKTVDAKQIASEKGLRTMIARCMHKEFHGHTTPEMQFIKKILDEAYENGLNYNVTDMRPDIIRFASNSTNNAINNLKLESKLHYKGKNQEAGEDPIQPEVSELAEIAKEPWVVFDIEVLPNLLVVNWKPMDDKTPRDFEGSPKERWAKYVEWFKNNHKPVNKMINPSPQALEILLHRDLVGFNCRRYDNHILYGREMGYSLSQIYELSHRIVSGDRLAFFGEAYNLSKLDIYDMASAGNKMSLKLMEIQMGFYHQELGWPWDKPVPEEMWNEVADYCENDVLATELAFRYLESDWTARQILADLAGMTVNNTTNSLTTRIIFDRIRNPQNEFLYRNLSQPVKELTQAVMDFLKDACPTMMSHTHGEDDSLLPYFPGYNFGPRSKDLEGSIRRKDYVSTYHGEGVGEGGYVYSESPEVYQNVALLDIASMHPHSVIAECLFGPRFTRRFKEIVDGRVSIKHEAWEEINHILDGKLTPYIARVKRGEITSKDLADALKTAINSVYGLTSAAFENAFRDPRNIDNIVAKRGALFMIDLKRAVQKRGYTVAHIKTDSIKIPNADLGIIKFVMDFGQEYGYTFEHEATYEKMFLANDSEYIAKYATAELCEQLYGPGIVPGDNRKKGGQWTATGKKFAIPYLFKTMFSHEPIEFQDLCVTFSVTGALYLDYNENLPNVEAEEELMKKYLSEHNLTPSDWAEIKNDWLLCAASDDPKSFEVFDEETKWMATDLMNLQYDIDKGHDYRFIGRVGLFTPIKPGSGAGRLLRESGGVYTSATGAKGYLWAESGSIGVTKTIAGDDRPMLTMDDIDYSYFTRLVDDARDMIGAKCDLGWFTK